MFRYTAVIRDPLRSASTPSTWAQSPATPLQPDLSMVFDGPHLRVFCTNGPAGANRIYALECGHGVVVGTLFPRIDSCDANRPKDALGPSESRRIIESGGRELLRSYWGRYVAFLCEPARGTVWVVRDPTGGMDCLTTRMGDYQFYFSSFEDVPNAFRKSLSVNWDYIVGSFLTAMPETRQTGIREITRILRGECEEISGGRRVQRFYWHPFEIASSGIVEDAHQAAESVRRITRQCVAAWASCYDSILLKLSGGLDSSVVLSCMRDARPAPNVMCVNHYYNRGSNNDERSFARLASQSGGFPLLEESLGTSISPEEVREVPFGPSPFDFVGMVAAGKGMRQIARRLRVSGLFSGEGGDEVFFEQSQRYACADFVYRKGLRASLFDLAILTAIAKRTSVWKAIWMGVRDGALRPPENAVMSLFCGRRYKPSPLIDQEIAISALSRKSFIHPWITTRADVPPGKVWQACAYSYTNSVPETLPRPGDPEEVTPLFSQPVMELCLRIPTEASAANGRDRAIARLAFSGMVPPEILRRRIKCVADEYTKHLVEDNIGYMREVLLDGFLAKSGTINRAALEAVLAGAVTKSFGYGAELCTFFSTEIWLDRAIGSGIMVAAPTAEPEMELQSTGPC